MTTGKEYLKKHLGETNIPEEYYENEIGEMMEWYAEDYHQEQVKNLSLCDVGKLCCNDELCDFDLYENKQGDIVRYCYKCSTFAI